MKNIFLNITRKIVDFLKKLIKHLPRFAGWKNILIYVSTVIIIIVGIFLIVRFFHFRGPTSTNSPAGRNTITIENKKFVPHKFVVSSGTGVTWVNQDTTSHTVTFDSFDSGTMAPQDIFSHMFDKPGTYKYHCKIHPSVKGTIVVR